MGEADHILAHIALTVGKSLLLQPDDIGHLLLIQRFSFFQHRSQFPEDTLRRVQILPLEEQAVIPLKNIHPRGFPDQCQVTVQIAEQFRPVDGLWYLYLSLQSLPPA